MLLDRMAEMLFGPDVVVIASTNLLDLHKPFGRELTQNPLHCPLGDPNHRREIADSKVGVSCETDQNMRMVREKGPTVRVRPVQNGHSMGEWRLG